MSVEDRLRAGLEANARAFVPEGEARLVQVHTRLRRRRALQGSVAVASVAAAVALIAVVSSSRPPADREEPVPATHSHRDDLGVRRSAHPGLQLDQDAHPCPGRARRHTEGGPVPPGLRCRWSAPPDLPVPGRCLLASWSPTTRASRRSATPGRWCTTRRAV